MTALTRLTAFFCCTIPTIAAVAADTASNADESRTAKVIRSDIHIRDHVEWQNVDVELHGNIVFHEGGELIVENATISQMCTYAREFRYQWEGGTLVTRNVIIGGTKQNGIVGQTYFELQHGTWESEDTTIRYSSGVTMGWTGHAVKFHATRLIAGPNPDSVILSCDASDVLLKDSLFNISLAVSAAQGGKGHLELPANEPVTRTFDASNVPGVKYRLQLINTRVPLWWVFFSGIRQDGPATEVVLGNCPRLIPSIIAHNLQGPLTLPAPWPNRRDEATELAIGNLTLKTVGQPVSTWCWGVYFSGGETDVTLRGQTVICELFLTEGRCLLDGDPNTFNAVNSCTTVEVGRQQPLAEKDAGAGPINAQSRPAELVMRNVALGRFQKDDVIIGQVTAHQNGRVRIENARCARLKLLTKGNGTIEMSDIDKQGEFEELKQGGSITIER